MNNEIKDIIEKLKDREETYQFCKQYKLSINDWIYEAHYLLDYITNLQKEVRANNDLIPHFKNRVKELKKEITNLQKEKEDYKSRVEKAVEQAKEKIKRYESYINDLKKGNYPSPTIRQERQELIFRIREQEDLLNILQNGSEENG